MPSVELSKLQGIGPARALSDSDRAAAAARPASASASAASAYAKPGVAVEIGAASEVDLASPPVDPERVEKIRNALREGTYPLVPAKIADAMIAAQVSFAVLPAGER
jgi:negative regulator of flagellin synthesis FlgM